MAKIYKVGQKLTNANGDKVVITSILPNGAATVNYSSGSGKTGYAGVIPANMLSKHGTLFSAKTQIASIGKQNLHLENTNFSLEEYDKYFEENDTDDETEALTKELLEVRERSLKDVDEVIEDNLTPKFPEGYNLAGRMIDGTGTGRYYNKAIRYILKQYATIYGAGEEFELAKKKLSTVYHMTQAAGYTHGSEEGLKEYQYSENFYPDFKEALTLLKNRDATEADVQKFRNKVGLCKYGFNHIEYSEGLCDEVCKVKTEKYETFDLPDPIW